LVREVLKLNGDYRMPDSHVEFTAKCTVDQHNLKLPGRYTITIEVE